MTVNPDIVGISIGHPVMAGELVLMEERDRRIPGSWRFNLRRYQRLAGMQAEDRGLLLYQNPPDSSGNRLLGFRFCTMGYACGRPRGQACETKAYAEANLCAHQVPVLDVFRFDFGPAHLIPFLKGLKRSSELQDMLAFRMEGLLERPVPMDARISNCLREISSHSYHGEHEDIYLNAQAQILLLSSIDALYIDEEAAVPACKFLDNEQDREKIVKAREVLLRHIGEPITIRELSRKVAINECYLKKGFKVLYGSTIFDFYQGQRMEHARYLLHEKGLSVSEVSLQLGYSSISHFSTAFKKHTGLKPCELLVR